jgi:hypothetical protein
MGQSFPNHEAPVSPILDQLNMLVGAATDGTKVAYIDMRKFRRSGLEVLWTAGGGTLAFTVEASMYQFKNATDAALGDSGSVFQDISNAFLGTTSKDATFISTDSAGISGCVCWLKLKAVVASSGVNTVLTTKFWLCS